jgi:hypothetical protein
MDEDAMHHAVPSESLPPLNRTSCAMESVDVMRRIIALFMLRDGINNFNFGRFEMDHSPVDTLMIRRDKTGNVNLTIES